LAEHGRSTGAEQCRSCKSNECCSTDLHRSNRQSESVGPAFGA
jgi:hypothetical protein